MEQQPLIRLETVVARAEGLIAADLDGATALLSIDRGKYYGLDAVGSRIWELTATPATVGEIIRTLRHEYAVSADTCYGDVGVFLDKLIAEGLVTIV